DKETIRCINPNTLNLPILQTARDASLVSDIHRRIPVLDQENKTNQSGRQIEFRQGLFNMTSDKKLFDTREGLHDRGLTLSGNIFAHANGTSLPLYEAKLTSQFNHRHGTFDGVPPADRFGTRAQTIKPTTENLCDPYWQILPRYWVDESIVCNAIPKTWA